MRAEHPPWLKEFLKQFHGAKPHESLKKHTTFRIGGPADAYLEVGKTEALVEACRFARERAVPVFIIGKGSNLLVRDGGIRGIVLRLRGAFETIEFLDGGLVRAGAAVRLPTLVVACAERGLAGAESLVGVPGTVGGGLVMNAGTREGEIGDLVREVGLLAPETLEERWLDRSKIEFRYRHSSLEGSVILGGVLGLKRGGKVDILERVRRFQKKRQLTQPIHTFNVGSIFKNPPNHFVARLIEDAGLKGLRRGGAKVSELHANFIENDDGATSADVLALVEDVRGAVRARAGVELELEMKVVGEA